VFSPGRRQLKLGIWCRSLGGVGHRVHFLELGDGDVGVDLGRRELCVAQDCLDKADIGAVGQHVGRHRVAKEVRGAGFIDASLKFFWRDAEQEDQDDTRGVQASLFEAPLRPLKPQEFTFFYRYTSGGAEHTQSIQDWEVHPGLGSAGHLPRVPARVRLAREGPGDDGPGVRSEHPHPQSAFHHGQHGQAPVAVHRHRTLALRSRSARTR
jgi:hypothetical protein